MYWRTRGKWDPRDGLFSYWAIWKDGEEAVRYTYTAYWGTDANAHERYGVVYIWHPHPFTDSTIKCFRLTSIHTTPEVVRSLSRTRKAEAIYDRLVALCVLKALQE